MWEFWDTHSLNRCRNVHACVRMEWAAARSQQAGQAEAFLLAVMHSRPCFSACKQCMANATERAQAGTRNHVRVQDASLDEEQPGECHAHSPRRPRMETITLQKKTQSAQNLHQLNWSVHPPNANLWAPTSTTVPSCFWMTTVCMRALMVIACESRERGQGNGLGSMYVRCYRVYHQKEKAEGKR